MNIARSGYLLPIKVCALLFTCLVCFVPIAMADSIVPVPTAVSPSLTTMGWVGVYYQDPNNNTVTDVETQVFGISSMSVGPSTWSGDANSGTGSGTASVGYGSASLYSGVSRTGTSSRTDLSGYYFNAYAYARFTDTMTINDPNLAGTTGSTTFDITLSGVPDGGKALLWVRPIDPNPNNPQPSYVLNVQNALLSSGQYTYTTAPIFFTYGESFSFYVALGAMSSLYGYDPGSHSIDMLNTLTLSDIDVYDQFGGINMNYAIETASGAVYPFAGVPEPTTMLLLGSGLIGLVGLRRRFKK
jgi:hypothetical protein